jgi:hypothetical protein
MDQGNRENAERVGFFLYCYMLARRQCVGGYAPPGNAIWLADLIQRSTREFVGILIDPDAEPPIMGDRDRPEFFHAIIERDDTALPGLVDLDAWRNFVHNNGPMPQSGIRSRYFPNAPGIANRA